MVCLNSTTWNWPLGSAGGELLGLKWEDIDLEQGDLRVRRQIARINGEVVEAPLKRKTPTAPCRWQRIR